MPVAVHMAKLIPPIDYRGVPASFVGKLSAVCRTANDCYNLAAWFGAPNFAPNFPVMVLVPGADAPTLIAGMGYATAAELRDCAVVTWHQQTEKLRNTGKLLDFDTLRERCGLMRREEVDTAVRDAMARRAAQHKANPVTDPPRKLVYPNPTNRTVFSAS